MFRDMGTSCREAGRRLSTVAGDDGLLRSFFWGAGSEDWVRVSQVRLGSGAAEVRPCSRPCLFSWPVDGGPEINPQPDASSSGAAPAQVADLLTPSAAAYLLRGHGSRRAVLFASWSGSAASAQPLVISAIDLLQMS